MHKPKKFKLHKDFLRKEIFKINGAYIKSIQYKSGAIPSNKDGTHDPWDHIESIMGLNIYKDIEASKSAFNWLTHHQNSDGSWYAKYYKTDAIEKNKPTHFSPYIAVAALHFFRIFKDINFLQSIWSSIELAVNFSVELQQDNGTIPWSINNNSQIENDYLLTGCSSILKSIECGIALSKILNETENIEKWKKAHLLLSNAIQDPDGKFDLIKDRKRFSMDWYYPILSGCLKQDEKSHYINKIFKDFYLDGIGIKCVIEEPWVTVAETSEFILALMCAGYDDEAKRLLFDVINISDEEGIPFMGWQYEQNIFWPEEKPSWTAAALMLSADCVFDYSDASDLFKSDQRLVFYETS
ncbi:MAG: hypothetical protein VXZ97_04620 [Pseudomonadota bacterium]|nr:hypothetical protein [Pseudomonadota bacterium]